MAEENVGSPGASSSTTPRPANSSVEYLLGLHMSAQAHREYIDAMCATAERLLNAELARRGMELWHGYQRMNVLEACSTLLLLGASPLEFLSFPSKDPDELLDLMTENTSGIETPPPTKDQQGIMRTGFILPLQAFHLQVVPRRRTKQLARMRRRTHSVIVRIRKYAGLFHVLHDHMLRLIYHAGNSGDRDEEA